MHYLAKYTVKELKFKVAENLNNEVQVLQKKQTKNVLKAFQ